MPSKNAIKIRRNLEALMQTADEKTASKCVHFAPHWKDLWGKTVEKDFRFQHKGTLYATNQPSHTFQAHWEPGPGLESLYREIPEWFEGTQEDPIPYSGNMALEVGKYYTEDGILYRCKEDTIIAVHNHLADLPRYAEPVSPDAKGT